MKYDKAYLRSKSLLKRKKKYSKTIKFNFNLIFSLITKHFHKKKIIIAGYYPSNYEVNVLQFLEEASKKNFRITLPVIKSSNTMCFKQWFFKEPLYLNKFGIPEHGLGYGHEKYKKYWGSWASPTLLWWVDPEKKKKMTSQI